jgi:hypothetical protein
LHHCRELPEGVSSRKGGGYPLVKRKDDTMELLIVIAIVAFWIVLNKWILPKCGVPT